MQLGNSKVLTSYLPNAQIPFIHLMMLLLSMFCTKFVNAWNSIARNRIAYIVSPIQELNYRCYNNAQILLILNTNANKTAEVKTFGF